VNLVQDSGRFALLLMLAAFIVTFAATRLIVRAIRSGRGPFGNVQVDGLHIHHLVPGIFLLLIAGTLEFTVVPHGAWRNALAAVFGVGAAIYAAGLGTVMLVASNPFAPEQGESRLFFAAFLAANIALALVAVLKGRLFLGIGGVMIPFLGLVAALRLARPGSPWFRRFYPPGTVKYVRATKRAKNRGLWGADRVKSTLSGLPHNRP
jgi:hypothetical protein